MEKGLGLVSPIGPWAEAEALARETTVLAVALPAELQASPSTSEIHSTSSSNLCLRPKCSFSAPRANGSWSG